MTELAETRTWHDRFDLMGRPFEAQVSQMLIDRGWTVSRGDVLDQVGTTDDRIVRGVIERAYPATPLRWMPDFLVTRSLFMSGPEAFFVDAKASAHGANAQGCVALAALDAQRRWRDFSGINVFYAFSNGFTASITDFDAKGSTGRVVPGRGSGDPYMMIEPQFCRTFDERFGTDLATTDEAKAARYRAFRDAELAAGRCPSPPF